MKNLLVGNQILKLPNFERPFYLTLSFCKLGYGAALLQKDDEVLKPIFYRSKTVTTGMLKPVYLMQLEALA